MRILKTFFVISLLLSMAIPVSAEVINTSVSVMPKQLTIEELQAEIARLTSLLAQIQASPNSSISGCLLLPSLSLGSRGESVVKLQEFLMTRNGVNWPVTIPATGYFGTVTRDAVIDFQVNTGVIPTRTSLGNGLVGPRTKAKIESLTCVTTEEDLVSEVPDEVVTTPEVPIEPVVPVIPERADGLYVSISPLNRNNLSWQSGDLGEILTLRFEAVGFDIDLQNLGLDFTKGDVSGIERLDVTDSIGVIIGSVNVVDKLLNLDLSKDIRIPSGSYKDLKFLVKVSDTTALEEGRFSLNIDSLNTARTFGTRVDTGETVYVTSPAQNLDQGVWLVDALTDGELTVITPASSGTYRAGDQVELKWYSSGLLSGEEVILEILDKPGVIGKVIVPGVRIENNQNYSWAVPLDLNPDSNTFAFRISCSIHECFSDSIVQNLSTE